MNSLSKILLAAVLLPALALAACPFLQVTVQESAQVTAPGTATFSVSLFNNGPSTQSIYLNSLCRPEEFDCQFKDLATPLVIPSGASATVHLQATVVDAQPGMYNLPLQVWSGFANACLEKRNLQLQVTGTGGQPVPSAAEAYVNPATDVIARPGDTVDYAITATNNRPERVYYKILAGSDEGNAFEATTTISPQVFSLTPGESKVAYATVTIPLGTPSMFKQFLFRVETATASAQVNYTDLPARIFVYSQHLNLQLESTPGQCLPVFHNKPVGLGMTMRNFGEVTGPFQLSISASSTVQPYLSFDESLFQLLRGESQAFTLTADVPATVAPGYYAYTLYAKYEGFDAIAFDSCIQVSGVSSTSALSRQEFPAPRGQLTTIPFVVENNGTLASNYSINYNPVPFTGIQLTVSPASFMLAPGERKTAGVAVQVSAAAQLGRKNTAMTIYSTAGQNEIALSLNIISANGSDSPLRVKASSYETVAGVPRQYAVRVTNAGNKKIDNPLMIIEGIPSHWWKAEATAQNIPASSYKDFLVTFKIPAGTPSGEYLAFITVISGLESTRIPTRLEVSDPQAKLSIRITNVSKSGTQPEVVTVRIAVTNDGNVPASQITASIPGGSGYLVSEKRETSLQPGQAQYLDVLIAPIEDEPSREVFISLSSREGANSAETIKLPALRAATLPTEEGDSWKIIAIILLFVAILVLISRDEVGGFMQKI
ncbi:MAG: hypothetical protein AABW54_00160 [Candidatus Micrarchaeota archaeon]